MTDKNFAADLPSGWVLEKVFQKNDRDVPVYKNEETGQEFYSKDDLFRYWHYWTVTRPLVESGELTYEGLVGGQGEPSRKMNDEGCSTSSEALVDQSRKPQGQKGRKRRGSDKKSHRNKSSKSRKN